MENRKEREIKISATISGDNFSPRKLLALTDLPLERCIEVGDVAIRKTFRKVYERGSAELEVVDNAETEETRPFDTLLDALVANYEAIKESGGTEINIWVAIFQSVQGNWWMPEDQIQKVAAVRGSLSVSYYRDDDQS